jgi:hypothetical protein
VVCGDKLIAHNGCLPIPRRLPSGNYRKKLACHKKNEGKN